MNTDNRYQPLRGKALGKEALVRFLAAGLVKRGLRGKRAADLAATAQSLRKALDKATSEAKQVKQRGALPHDLMESLGAVMLFGKLFFRALVETRVIPKSRARGVLRIAEVFFKSRRTSRKPVEWVDKYGEAVTGVLDTWQEWQDKSELQDDTESKFTVGPLIVHNVAYADEEKLGKVRELLTKTEVMLKASQIPGGQVLGHGVREKWTRHHHYIGDTAGAVVLPQVGELLYPGTTLPQTG